MLRPRWYHLVPLVMLIPGTCSALGLRWSGGGSTLSVNVATRCTLEVFVGPGEVLPGDWRLLWSADSCELVPIPIETSCDAAVAEITNLTSPTEMFGLLENRLDAQFCSSGSEPSAVGRYAIDLPTARRGAFQVVALDPDDPDSNAVLRSAVVSFNGGSDLQLPPVILRASITHQSTDYVVEAVGSGLAGTAELRLLAPDRSWEYTLSITAHTDTSIDGLGSIAAVVPASVLQAETDSGFTASLHLPAEELPHLDSLDPLGASCQVHFKETLLGVNILQPKDFALVPGGWTPEGQYVYHLFYIRQNYATANSRNPDGSYMHGGPDSTENKLGHAVSNNLENWCWLSLPQVGQPGDPDYRARCQPTVPISKRDTLVIHSRAGKFDSKHVWAPSIVRVGLTYYMFYTGVDAAGDQRMGLATSTDLFNWTQLDEPIFDYLALGDWAAPEVLEFGNEAQFRDPFVMPDPAVAGQWLMYFVTVPAIDHGATVVGVAQSSDLMQWVNDRPLMNTLRAPDPRAESPHAFFSQGQWWLFYTSSFDSPDEELELSRWGVYGQSNPANPTDGIAGNWSPEAYVDALIWDEHLGQPTGSYFYWKGSEYLRFSTINDVQFMAAWNDQSWGISITRVNDTVLPTLFVEHCGFDPWTSVDSSPRPWLPRLLIASLRPGDGTVELAIEMAQGIEASLAVHDVQGRVVRRLFHGRVEAGRTRLSWNGHGDSDRPLGPGVYFARLSTSLGGDTVRIPIVR